MTREDRQILNTLVANILDCRIKDVADNEATFSQIGMTDWEIREKLFDEVANKFGLQIDEQTRYEIYTMGDLVKILDGQKD